MAYAEDTAAGPCKVAIAEFLSARASMTIFYLINPDQSADHFDRSDQSGAVSA
jgi:hypothetical protein